MQSKEEEVLQNWDVWYVWTPCTQECLLFRFMFDLPILTVWFWKSEGFDL